MLKIIKTHKCGVELWVLVIDNQLLMTAFSKEGLIHQMKIKGVTI